MNPKKIFSSAGMQNTKKQLALLLSLLAVAVLLAGHSFLSQSSPFVSKEVRFSEGSESGLRIVPASCPSSPHYSGECDPPAKPDTNGCVLFATPSTSDGGSVVLSWNSQGVTGLRIFPGNIPVGASGTLNVYPSAPTTYTMTAVGSGGIYSCQDDVIPPPPSPTPPPPPPPGGCSGEACIDIPPPELTFSADRYLVQRGDTTELYWTAENVNYCVLENYGSVDSDVNGNITDYATTTDPINSQTDFVLTCGGEDGTIIEEDVRIDIIPIFCETGVPGCNNPPGQSNAAPGSQVASAAQAAAAAATEADLSATIRAAVLSDPRSQSMTEAEIDALVAALTQEAEGEGVSSHDILWRPQEQSQLVPQDGVATCNFLCMLNQAFGLDGSDVAIPIGLGITAGILLFVIGSILHHRFGHHPVAGDLKVSAE